MTQASRKIYKGKKLKTPAGGGSRAFIVNQRSTYHPDDWAKLVNFAEPCVTILIDGREGLVHVACRTTMGEFGS
jgi:hypothetical protein